MTARSGLFVAPTGTAGTAPIDARLALSSLIGSTPQLASGGAITQSATTMAFTIANAVLQLPDPSNSAASFLSPIDQTVLTPAQGPATGSRIDLIVGKQNNPESGDADSRASFSLIAGQAGAPGVAPAVPAGYFRYADINVPANATNAAACTVTLRSPTSFAPPDIQCPTFALLSTVTGTTGQLAVVTNDTAHPGNNGVYGWRAGTPGQWVLLAPTQGPALVVNAAGTQVVSGSFVQLTAWSATPDVNRGFSAWSGGALTIDVPGLYDLAAEVWTPTQGIQSVAVTKNSTTAGSGVVLQAQQTGLTAFATRPVALAAGDILRVFGAAPVANQTVQAGSFLSVVWRAAL